MKYNRPMNVFDKLQSGWFWCGEIFEEWCYTMTHDDGEFFHYLQSDYCKYEEDMYYVVTKPTKPVPKEQSIARTQR